MEKCKLDHANRKYSFFTWYLNEAAYRDDSNDYYVHENRVRQEDAMRGDE